MRVDLSQVKIGMRVWSRILNEYFTVENIHKSPNKIILISGVYSMEGSPISRVKVEQKWA